jgi:hypothetical protein
VGDAFGVEAVGALLLVGFFRDLFGEVVDVRLLVVVMFVVGVFGVWVLVGLVGVLGVGGGGEVLLLGGHGKGWGLLLFETGLFLQRGLLNQWLKHLLIMLLVQPTLLEHIIELLMRVMGRQLPKLNIIIVPPLQGITERRICLTKPHKLLLILLIPCLILGMILQPQPPESPLNILEAGIPLNLQNLIKVLLSLGIVLLEERLLLLQNPILLEEPLESLQSLILRELMSGKLVVMVTPRGIG